MKTRNQVTQCLWVAKLNSPNLSLMREYHHLFYEDICHFVAGIIAVQPERPIKYQFKRTDYALDVEDCEVPDIHSIALDCTRSEAISQVNDVILNGSASKSKRLVAVSFIYRGEGFGSFIQVAFFKRRLFV